MTDKLKATTDKVVEMYSQYPYPLAGNHSDFFFSWVYNQLINCKKTFSRILDAGCGTGNVTFDIARAFPESQIVAIDLTDHSLEVAREKLSKSNFTNIEFKKSNLIEFDETLGTFDLIHCQGVVHHLASPIIGMRNLNKYLNRDGILYFWVYMELGRRYITELKEIINLLGIDKLNLEEQLEKLNIIFNGFPNLGNCGGLSRDPGLKIRKMNQLKYKLISKVITSLIILRDDGLSELIRKTIELVLKRKISQFDTRGEGKAAGLVDTYLNVNEIFFRFQQLNEMIIRSGFKLEKIVQGMSEDVEIAFKHNVDLLNMIVKLPLINQYALIELLEKPSGIGMICKKV